MATIIGTSNNDTITPTLVSGGVTGGVPSGAADFISGGDGNDTINGGDGADTVFGGYGNDYIFAVPGTSDSIDGGSGAPYIDTLDTTAFAGNFVIDLATGLTNFAGESFVNIENLISGAGNDSITGTAGANLINGGAGNDIIDGGDGNDTINGGGGADTAFGGNGDDYIFAVLGRPESIDGGAGIDTLDTTAFTGNYVVNLATGLTNFAGESFVNMENLISGAGNDRLIGTAGANLINSGDGNDTINGGGGPDTVFGGNGDDYIFAVPGTRWHINGEAGIDTLDTTAFTGNYKINLASGATSFSGESFSSIENLMSGSGNDSLTGTVGANLINGGAGNDTINGGGGADTSFGGSGNDYIFAGPSTSESIDGGTDIDTLDTTAFTGNYVVNLATGLTNFAGESFVNMENLISGSGNDSLTGSSAANLIDGGDGNDTINGGGGFDTLNGGSDSDTLYGGTGSDTINGGGGADIIQGGSGNDSINGGTGNDIIKGGDGNDYIAGGNGGDQLSGGLNADTFDFNAVAESTVAAAGRDFILDFSQAQGDRIDLATIDANSTVAGDQAFSFISGPAFSGTAGELLAVASGADTLVLADINGDGIADFSILVAGIVPFNAGNFIL